MTVGLAGIIFIVCFVGVLYFINKWRKVKRIEYLILGIILGIIAIIIIFYFLAVLIFLAAID